MNGLYAPTQTGGPPSPGTTSARERIRRMLTWFVDHRVDRWDLALRWNNGAFQVKNSADLDIRELERRLPWARWANAHGTEIYIRPARGHSWPVIFLDDVERVVAVRIARKYAAMVVRTSRQGGCHVWLLCSQHLDENQRCRAQRYLQPLINADPASVSGEHWGRLAGFKNHKRNGQWIDIIATTDAPPWNPTPALTCIRIRQLATRSTIQPSNTRQNRDESVAEFAWCCHCLRHGWKRQVIIDLLTSRARSRGKRNPLDYALRTLNAARDKLRAPHHGKSSMK